MAIALGMILNTKLAKEMGFDVRGTASFRSQPFSIEDGYGSVDIQYNIHQNLKTIFQIQQAQVLEVGLVLNIVGLTS